MSASRTDTAQSRRPDRNVQWVSDQVSDQRADLACNTVPLGVPLREHIDSILAEHLRAVEIAEREREKAAVTLRAEVARVADMAERERSKAAEALAKQLKQSIQDGDLHLRQHIDQQYAQISAALQSSLRETGVLHNASEKAIAKAEAANEKRFEAVNEFRAQLTDQTASFLLREVAEGQFAKLESLVAADTKRLDQITGGQRAVDSGRTARDRTVGLWVAGASAVIALVALLVTVVLAANGVLG